jgi:Hemerythrin HHE cation binding domain
MTLIDRLEEEHRGIRTAFRSVVTARPECKQRAVSALVRSIVQHEVGEEVVVYPAARRLGVAPDLILDARLAEQAALDTTLDRLGREEVHGERFTELLRDVAQQVDVHTRYEEQTVLEPLRTLLSGERMEQLGVAYARTVAAVPPYPYPSTETCDVAAKSSLSPRGAMLALLRRIRDHDKAEGRR